MKLRSVGAVAAGFVAIVVLSIGTDLALHATGVYPPFGQSMSDPMFFFSTLYRTVYSIAGCYLTARLAPAKPMQHALILGVIGLVTSIIGAVATWDRGPEFGPHWYPLALVALALPCAWAGGKLRVQQLGRSPEGA